ncbi:MAG: nuclear transport factor 2 family protein [Phycisphaeraceae bacterium]
MTKPIGANTPQDTDRQFIAAVNRGDVEAMLEFYEPGGGLFLISTGQYTTSLAAMRAEFEGLLAMKPKLTIKELVVTMHDDATLATSRMRVAMDATAPDGSAIHQEFHTLEVLRKQPDGTWRYAIDDPHGSERG